MKSCPRCGRQNEDDVRFCGRCGLDIVEYEKHQTRPQSDETMYCYRHPKEATNLSCGRCGKPICTKCAAIGPAGPRCPDCAKQNVAFRPAAVVHEAKRTVFSLARIGPWGIYVLAFVLISVIGMFRGCGSSGGTHINQPPPSQEQDQDSNS